MNQHASILAVLLASAVMLAICFCIRAYVTPSAQKRKALGDARTSNGTEKEQSMRAEAADAPENVTISVANGTNLSSVVDYVPMELPIISRELAERLGIKLPKQNASDDHAESSAAPTQRCARGANATTVTAVESSASQKAFWSQDRLNDAEGVNVPIVSSQVLSELGIKPDSRPHPLAASQAKVESANLTQSPYEAFGKLFFQNSRGRHQVCSGAYVATKVVLTAAHCVFDVETQDFHEDYQFIQQFHKGKGARKGILKAFLHKGWYQNKSAPGYAYDYAFLAMKDASSSGYLDLDTAESYDSYTAAGYPTNFFQGTVLQTFSGRKGRISDESLELLDDPMREGCSGGAWFVEKTKNRYAAVGVNSYGLEGSTSMFSPRIRSHEALNLFKQAQQLAGT